MSEDSPRVGSVAWVDLTVPNAEEIKDFYSEIAGWSPEPVDMGEYSDFHMVAPATGQPAAGVCHARGMNADLPPQWLIYIVVDDFKSAAARCTELGGTVLMTHRGEDGGGFCVIKDPAGAMAALYTPAPSQP